MRARQVKTTNKSSETHLKPTCCAKLLALDLWENALPRTLGAGQFPATPRLKATMTRRKGLASEVGGGILGSGAGQSKDLLGNSMKRKSALRLFSWRQGDLGRLLLSSRT